MAVAARPTLLTPGLRPVDRTLETHWVRPGAATAVRLRPDDRLTVINRDGGQVAEMTVLDAEGGEDAAAVGARADAEATVLRGLARNGGAEGMLGALHAEGLLPEDARALRLFDQSTPRGATQSFVAEREATAIVAAPGGRVVDGRLAGLTAAGRDPARDPAAGRRRSSCRRRWPSRGSTSESTAPAPWPTRSRRASTSRSSTSRASSARTSSPSTATSSSAGSSGGSTRPRRAR